MRMFQHEHAESVCQIMGQSRPPTEFVVFPVRRAVHRSRPSRTDIRVPRLSMPICLLAPQRLTPTVVDIVDYGGGIDHLMDEEQLPYIMFEHFRLLTVFLPALTGLFRLRYNLFCAHTLDIFACDLYGSS